MTLLKNTMRFLIAGIILIASFSFYGPTQTDSQEYILKAAFIYRFADYIEWINESENSTFTIGILGESSIITPLNEIAKDKKVKNKSVTIKLCKSLDDMNACQVVFVSKNYNTTIETIVSKAYNNPILIITEQKDACEKGAHINFIISDNKLKFEINLKAALKANFKISSQLLQHAILINT
jgi:hypothetical protein